MYTLAEIAKLLKAEVQGDGKVKIIGLAALETAGAGQICFYNNSRYRQYLNTTQAAAVLLTKADAALCSTNAVIVSNPHLAYAKVAKLFEYKVQKPAGIHPSAVIGKNCKIDPSVSIGENCIIESNVEIGKNTVIGAGCSIGDYVSMGENCRLFPRVTVGHHVEIGEYVVIQSGAVVGSEGFGNVKDDQGVWMSIPQLGGVKIGNHVEIGANTTIDRGSLKDTIIADHVRLDNLIQVAHNVYIGENTAIAACTGIAGSTRIGAHCMIGGGARIADNITICDYVILLGACTVPQSITKPGVYGAGTPLMEYKDAIKNALRYRQLDKLARKVIQLEKKCNE